MMNLLQRGVRHLFDKPVELNERSPFADAVLHGPTYPGNNVITQSILGRGPTPPALPIIPDLFLRNVELISGVGATIEILIAPSGGVWLMKIQTVDGAITNAEISMGDLDVGFGAKTVGVPIDGMLGPTPIYWNPFVHGRVLDLSPGGVWFPGMTRIGLRAEDPSGAMETVFMFSFATRNGQVSVVRQVL